ncbi:DNA adenine methylase [Polyangium fumosum]|uniref:site-specific DNA-methyltransferase (adenine-specific) n=1 Tax=Polyangium fumosum TaxID=889272 RepID=A0A4U1III2_9BACT|nr:DNA adenine methylase [Polyangium fumosum]TKC93696.1 DNA adenine methylase [Polyangium fumosum]
MTIAHSPLRYPGGKQVLANLLAHVIDLNNVRGGTYAEPYAGGAGAALALLFSERVDRIVINDADRCVYSFWHAIVFETESFIELLQSTEPSVEGWARQREIYQNPNGKSILQTGFATFFLNRCNRSGIISNGGPIGGRGQAGKWKINARWNGDELRRRIQKIALYRDRISVTNKDAVDFLKVDVTALDPLSKPFVYLDPPYYEKGRNLYLNYYHPDDHAQLASYITSDDVAFLWVMSYDNVPEIHRLYRRQRRVPFSLGYSAREVRDGSEVLILKRGLKFPREWAHGIPQQFISCGAEAMIPRVG